MLRNALLHTLALTVALSAVAPAGAQTRDPWRLRLSAVQAEWDEVGSTTGDLGASLAAEYRVHPRFGLELSITDDDLENGVDIELEDMVIGSFEATIGFTPVLLAGNVYLTPGRRAELYLGPVVGYADLGPIRAGGEIDGEPIDFGEDTVELENPFVYGAQIGVDVALGDHFLLSAGATYLDVPVDVEGEAVDVEDEGTTGHLDVYVFRLGIGFRF